MGILIKHFFLLSTGTFSHMWNGVKVKLGGKRSSRMKIGKEGSIPLDAIPNSTILVLVVDIACSNSRGKDNLGTRLGQQMELEKLFIIIKLRRHSCMQGYYLDLWCREIVA